MPNGMSAGQSESCVLTGGPERVLKRVGGRIGIIHIDEVDKLARRGGSGEGASWGGRDVGGEGVQQGQ